MAWKISHCNSGTNRSRLWTLPTRLSSLSAFGKVFCWLHAILMSWLFSATVGVGVLVLDCSLVGAAFDEFVAGRSSVAALVFVAVVVIVLCWPS